QGDQQFVEERIAHAIDLHEWALAQRLLLRESDRDARTRHRRVDADAGLRPEERALVVEARQLMKRNLDRVRQHIEALEAIDAGPGLTEASGEDPRVEQVEDRGGVGEE